MWVNRIKQFFGFFNLTEFERELLQYLESELPERYKGVLRSQLALFNKVDRVLSPAEQLPFGHTSFFWTQFGKARFDYPKKFPSDAESEKLATLKVHSLIDDNEITVAFVLVHGFLFSIKYYSNKNIFIPKEQYKIYDFSFEFDFQQ